MITNKYKLEDSLGFLAGRLSRLILKRYLEEFEKNNLHITAEQWVVLVHLWEQDGINQRTITEMMHKDKASVTRLINSLETKGLLQRISSEGDGREKFVYLTDKGRISMQLSTNLVQGILDNAYSGINDAEMSLCKSVLRRVYMCLE